MELLASHACFGGEQRFYRHASAQVGLPMRFSVFLPSQALGARAQPVPALVFLAGLTCTEETFMIKAGAQRLAAEAGLALIAPDTSPRGAGIAGETDDWDFGVGAGFYLDAVREPWSQHYRMESWLMHELLPMLDTELRIDRSRTGISGHSMGGHGALTLALRHPQAFSSREGPHPFRPAFWSTRDWRTSSSRNSCSPNGWKPLAGPSGSRSRSGAIRVTITVTISSPVSWPITSPTTRVRCSVERHLC
jgi:S-formylglutathione hydrolase